MRRRFFWGKGWGIFKFVRICLVWLMLDKWVYFFYVNIMRIIYDLGNKF